MRDMPMRDTAGTAKPSASAESCLRPPSGQNVRTSAVFILFHTVSCFASMPKSSVMTST